MHGFPTETEAEALMTLDFIYSIKWLHIPYFNILRIYANTDMHRLAVEKGISPKAIFNSENLYFHQLPETLPFSKNFTLKLQTDFFNRYFLSKVRLRHVLPYQMNVLTEDEIIKKYDTYLPAEIKRFSQLLQFMDLAEDEAQLRSHKFLAKNCLVLF